MTDKKDQDSPIYAFEDGNAINLGTFSTNQMAQSNEEMPQKHKSKHEASAIPPGTGNANKVDSSHGSSDGYTLVTEGVK